MKNLPSSLILVLIFVAFISLPAGAAQNRTLEGVHPAASIEGLALEAGVGDVQVLVTEEDVVRYEVVLNPRRGGFFSSMKRAEREVDEAVLEAELVGSELQLQIESDSDERRFEENWIIELPARLAFDLDLGVGDVEIRGREGRVEIEAGVGDVLIEDAGGTISVEIGVGDTVVSGSAATYAYVESSAGVGNAQIKIRGKRIASDGFVGHSASWTGDGVHRLSIEVGVGDARVTLD